jgi:hypothetical protein
MGLIRKTASLSTLGAVKYTSRREAQTKAALEEAKLAKAQRRALEAEQCEQAANGQPWYRQPTIGGVVRAYRQSKKDDQWQEPA